jgi:hypothetical protein
MRFQIVEAAREHPPRRKEEEDPKVTKGLGRFVRQATNQKGVRNRETPFLRMTGFPSQRSQRNRSSDKETSIAPLNHSPEPVLVPMFIGLPIDVP